MLPPNSESSLRELIMRTWFIANCLAGWFVFGLGALLFIVAVAHFRLSDSFAGGVTAAYGWLYQKMWRDRSSTDATRDLPGVTDLPGAVR
jgi:hypothetical protein